MTAQERSPVLLWTVIASVALAIVACGGSSSAQVGPPINIGVEGPMTGQYADVGAGFWRGAQDRRGGSERRGGPSGRSQIERDSGR